jgi:hypothetical protein
MQHSNFEARQRSYYLNEINRALPTRDNVADLRTIQTALGTPDPAMPTAARQVADIARLTSTFGAATNAQQMDAQCHALPSPGPAMRAADARTGCGWWLPTDTGTPSTGAYGTRRGPMNVALDQQVGPGRWIWDPREAQQAEAQRQAARIQTCTDLQFSRMPNMGWCPGTGMALLTDGAGNPMFPQTPGGDCPGGGIITAVANCPAPAPPGTPGAAGGSGGVAQLCSPDANGALSPACLQGVVGQVCSSNGVLAASLGGAGYAGSSDAFNAANAYLLQRGFTIHSGIVNDGRVSVSDALSSVQGLKGVAGAADGSRAASAAQNLCYGTAFDPCALAGSDTGPFPPDCITKAALQAGWAAAGQLMPANGGMSFWNSQPNWGAVQGQLTSIKQTADAPGSSAAAQATAIGQVYGLSVKYPKQGCNNQGVMLYRYFFPTWDQSLFPVAGPTTHFLGRYIFRDGFPNKVQVLEDQTPAGGYLTEGQRYTTQFIPTAGGDYTFLVQSDDGMRVFVLEPGQALTASMRPVLDFTGTYTGPPATFTYTFSPGQAYTIVVDLWNGGGPWTFVLTGGPGGAGSTPLPPVQLSLFQDRRLPTIEWGFHRMQQGATGAVQDTGSIFQNMMLTQSSVGQIQGQPCMLVNYPQRAAMSSFGGYPSGLFNTNNGVIQGMRARAMKSYTMKLFVAQASVQTTQGTYSAPTVFSLYNVPSSNPTGYPRTFDPSIRQPLGGRTNSFGLHANGNAMFAYGIGPAAGIQDVRPIYIDNGVKNLGTVSTPVGQWFHFAFVWDDDFSGYTIYINGQQAGRAFVPAFDPLLLCEILTLGCEDHVEGNWWSGGIAWFRGFDYRLSQDQIKTDAADAWANVY